MHFAPPLRLAVFAVAFAMPSAIAHAQEAPTIGRVLDADRRAVAGAVVTFASSPCAGAMVGTPRLVHVTTDAEGRFRAMLTPGRTHSVWAIRATDRAGGLRSAVVEGVLAGAVVDVVAQFAIPAPLQLENVGTPLGDQPTVVDLWCGAQNSPRWRLPVTDGHVDWSVLPYGDWDGRVVDPRGDAATGIFAVRTPRSAVVAEPRVVRFRVLDEGGNAVAGARVVTHVSHQLNGTPQPFAAPRSIGYTLTSEPSADDGAVALSWRGSPDLHFAVAAGRVSRVARTAKHLRVVDGVLQGFDKGVDESTPVALILRPAAPLVVNLRRGARALAGVEATVDARVVCKSADAFGATTWFSCRRDVLTDAEGTIRLAEVPRPLDSVQVAIADVDGVPCAILPWHDVPATPVTLDLDAWPIVTWQLQSDGEPAANARLVLWSVDARENGTSPVVLPGDRAGRVRVRMQPGEWFVMATDGKGIATLAHTAVGVDGTPAASVAVQVGLQPLSRFAGRVLDAAGAPARGVTFHFGGTMSTPEATDAPRLARLLRRFEAAINSGLLAGSRTDDEGRFDLRFLAVDGVQRAIAVMGGQQRPLTADTDVELRLDP